MRDAIREHLGADRGSQRQSDFIGEGKLLTQQSEAIRGHQRPSEAIEVLREGMLLTQCATTGYTKLVMRDEKMR
jgi:hypothetical protein